MKTLSASVSLALALAAMTAFAAGDPHESRAPAPPAGSAATDTTANIYAVRLLDQNLVGMTITNYGFIGNNFTSRAPSFEYPLGSGQEHLVRGGLWIGAIAVDDNGAFTGVTTGSIDGTAGDAAAEATEYSPLGESVLARSTLPQSRYYNPAAISEFDLSSTFWDGVTKPPRGREPHRPLHVRVKQENYSWSFSNYANMAFFHYVIRNDGAPLRNVWVGLYNELATGNKNLYSCWPPSGGCASANMGAWWRSKVIGWVDSTSMFTESFCKNPVDCKRQFAPAMVAVKLLGVRPGSLGDTSVTKITTQVWSFSPGSNLRDEDTERYALMSAGTIQPLVPLPDSLAPLTGDPTTLLAVGPFETLNPGDSIQVDFAYMGANDPSIPVEQQQLALRARVAQHAYDLDYKVPVPPPSPTMRVVPRAGAVDLYWTDAPESFEDPTSPNPRDFEGYRVYVGEDRLDLRLYRQFDLDTSPNDTTGFNTGFGAIRLATPEVVDGVTYRYKLTVSSLRDGFHYWVAVTSYDVGTSEIESLESGLAQNETTVIPAPAPGEAAGAGITVFPNPYRVEARWDSQQNVRDHFLWFANLPPKATIRIYTLHGDLIYETDFDGATYSGTNARGIYNPTTDLKTHLSGATWGWDMITRAGQAAATGLYVYSVEDRQSGKRTLGKFLIVKSDREGLH
ncbi:MAG: hypothetical protein IT347_06820 [Candidatus Eisenbacteria bacterium]|nr:hypothetical protein [Candidatus Eisenbacteria bacterium]